METKIWDKWAKTGPKFSFFCHFFRFSLLGSKVGFKPFSQDCINGFS